MKQYDEFATVVWQDKKRWCGLPWSFTRYSVIKRDGEYAKLINVNGWLTTRTEEIQLYRVDDLSVYQSLTNKIFGVGTITVYCRDASCNKLELRNIKNPYKVCALLNQMVIEDRKRVGVKQSEIQY